MTIQHATADDCDDDAVSYDIGKRPKLEGETESRGICAKKRISVKIVVLMASV